eukprot:TRINITY_DN100443_c0_g1_i1.p1 TRINITY_DN100443_c0_g1~~TRINITY_DN100443_c0_g1_i1.p1  ORF type:complete len:170 (+),score=33.48 TRINITY_DN100443_c0_g1_i1:23-532(+)
MAACKKVVKRPAAVKVADDAVNGRKQPKAAVSTYRAERQHLAESVCVKVADLRAQGYKDLSAWLEDSTNLYVGRHGRIFIHDGKEKRILHYSASKWQNPFKISASVTRQQVCDRYRGALLDGSLKDSEGQPLREQLQELRGLRLGCWCKPAPCHADVLAELVNRLPAPT